MPDGQENIPESEVVLAGEITRGIQKGGTAIDILPADEGMVITIENLSSNDGKAWELENNLLVDDTSIPAIEPAGPNVHGSRSILAYDGSNFLGFTRGGPSSDHLSFWITRYDIGLDYWEEPLLVENFSDPFTGQVELDVHDGHLFFIMTVNGYQPDQSAIYSVRTPVERWYWLSNSTVERVDQSSNIAGQVTSIVWGSNLILFWTQSNTGDLIRCEYRDDQWQNPIDVFGNVGLFSIQRFNVLQSDRMVLIHTSSGNTGINTTFSSTAGVTWSSGNMLAPATFELSSLSSTVHGNDLFLLAMMETQMIARMFRTPDGFSWSTAMEDITLTGSAGDGRFDGQISSDRSQVVATLENNGAVEIYVSGDGGRSYQLSRRMGGGSSDPVQTEEKDMIGVYESGILRILRFVGSNDGRMVTGPLSPLGIDEWVDIGLDITDLSDGAMADFRIWDQDLTEQLFPASGWVDMSTLSEGSINGISFTSTALLSGAWTSGSELEETVRVEVRLERGGTSVPALSRIYINYTTDFPFMTPLVKTENIVSTVNLTRTVDGYMLDDGQVSGDLIIGPVERENDWCDIISFTASAITSKVSYRVELLDRNMEPIHGFTLSRSNVAEGSSVTSYVRWGREFLMDLPASVDIINVRINILSEITNGRPVIESVSFLYSEAPVIDSTETDTEVLYRGETAEFRISTDDRDEPLEHLLVEMFHRSQGGIWESTMFMGQKLDGEVWTIPFVTEYDTVTGTYDLRLIVTDSMGTTTVQDLDKKMTILNNVPTGPIAYIDTDTVISGDEVDVIFYKEGSDLETPDGELTYNISTFRDGELYEDLGGFNGLIYTIPENTVLKEEEWEIMIETFDGMNLSAPFSLSFIVENSPPMVAGVPVNITIDEDSMPLILQPLSWFTDHDLDDLEMDLEAGPGLMTNESDAGSFTLAPEPNFNGVSFLRVKAFDGSVEIDREVEVIVSAVNDLPVLVTPPDVSLVQGEILEYFITAYDKVDDEPVTVNVDILGKVPGLDPKENFHLLKNGSFILNATNEMVGEFTIEIIIDDGTDQVRGSFNLTIINSNDPPTKPTIEIVPDVRVIIGDSLVTLSVNCTDPDTIWGDILSLSWSSDLQGELGEGAEIQVDLIEGAHTITVEVTDIDGSSASSSIAIEVKGSIDGTSETSRTATLRMYAAVIGVVAGILLGAAILLFAIMRRRKPEESEEGEKEGASGEGKEEKKEETPKKDEPQKEQKGGDQDNGKDKVEGAGAKNENENKDLGGEKDA